MTPEERAARERKQKIFIAVGGVLLVLVLVFFTLPKVLGGGSSSSPQVAGTETTSTSTVPGQVTPPPAGSTSPTPATTATAVTVAATTKLSSLSAFRPKDPFVQQVATPDQLAAAAATSTAPTGDAAKAAKGSKVAGSTQKFSVGAKAAVTSTIVTVNGARQVVAPGARFPAADPLFVLVAEKPESKSIVIGVVGGAYSGGDRTTTLKVGRPLTLVNTATGAKYKISLVSVGSGDQSTGPTPKP